MFRANTAPSFKEGTKHNMQSKHEHNTTVTDTNSFLFKLHHTILTHPITIVAGEDGCGKTSTICFLKENKFSSSFSSSSSSSSSVSSNNNQFESILHLCGTTLDSVNPKKIARRLIVELCRILKSQLRRLLQDDSKSSAAFPSSASSSTTFTSLETEVETLLSAANTAPDEHLAEITLQSLETFANIQSKHFADVVLSNNNNNSKLDRNLVIFIDAIDVMFAQSETNSEKLRNKKIAKFTTAASSWSVSDSPIMQLLDLLPLQSETLFPRIRFVFSLRRDNCDHQQQQRQRGSSNGGHLNIITEKVLERLAGGVDCFSSSAKAVAGGVPTTSTKGATPTLIKDHHACLMTFPLSLTKTAARNIISSQLQVLGKQWSSEMMKKAVMNLPDSHHSHHQHNPTHDQNVTSSFSSSSSSSSSSSLAYSFFATCDAEKNRNERKRQQQQQVHSSSNDEAVTAALENEEILVSHFLSTFQKIALPPKSSSDISLLKAFFSSKTSTYSSSSSSQNAHDHHDHHTTTIFNMRCGSPRYISVLIRELVATATFETLETTFDNILDQCETTTDLLRYVIERVGESFGLDDVLSVISCLLCTEIGLSEREIVHITGVQLRTVVAVLGNGGMRDFVVDRAGVLKGSRELEDVFLAVCARNDRNPDMIKTMTRCGAVRMFLQLLNEQPKESLGRVCRELPQLFLSIFRPRCLARFLARQDVMTEFFVASKKDEFLGLWKECLFLDSSIDIDDPSWLFPVFTGAASFSQRTLFDESEESKAPMIFFPNSSFSSSSTLTMMNSSARRGTSAAASSLITSLILPSDHAEFYHTETMHPLRDAHRIEVIILLARLWGSFNKNDTAMKMLKNLIETVKRIECGLASPSPASSSSEEKNTKTNEITDSDDHKIIQSTKTQLLQRLAQAQVREGRFQQAVAVVKEALTFAPEKLVPGLLKVLGRGFRKLGDYSQALECFDLALKSINAHHQQQQQLTSTIINKTTTSNLPASTHNDNKKALHTESTSAYFQKMDFDVASCLDEKADCLRKLDRNVEALSILKKALSLKQASLPSRHPAIADTLYSIAAAEKANGNSPRAFNLVSEGIAIIENFYGKESKRLFDLKFVQASCAVVLDHLPLALILFQELLDFSNRRFGENKVETAETMQQLAQVFKKMGRYRQASELLPRAFESLKRILVGGVGDKNNSIDKTDDNRTTRTEHPKLVKILIQLADLDRKVGKHADALKHAEEALEMSKRLWENDEKARREKQQQQQQQDQLQLQPKESSSSSTNKSSTSETTPLYDVQTAEAFIALASAKLKLASDDEHLDQIAKACQTALTICEARLGESHITTAACLTVFGDVQRRMTNQLLGALDKYQRALKIFEDSFGKWHVEVTDNLYKIGRCQKKMHWYSRAQKTYEEAMERMIQNAEQKKLGGGATASSSSSSSSTGSSKSSSKQQSTSQSIGPLNSLFASKRKQFLPHQLNVDLQSLDDDTSTKSTSDSRQRQQHLHTTTNNDDDNDSDVMRSPKMALLQQSLGDTFRKQMEIDKARRLYELALETNRFHYGSKHEEIAECLNGLAMCAFLDDRYEEAFEMETSVVSMTIELLGPNNRHTKNRQRNLQMIVEKMQSSLLTH